MKRIWLVFIALLCLSSALAARPGGRKKRAHLPEHLEAEMNGNSDSQKSLVARTLAELQTLHGVDGRGFRARRKRGALSVAAHYTRRAFAFLFQNGPGQEYLFGAGESKKAGSHLTKAVAVLESNARKGSSDAIFALAEMNFHGNYTHPKQYDVAFRYFNKLAALNGNSSAQNMVGLMYATGLGGSVERDQAKALLYHTFAAEGSDIRSQITTAFRHHSGIGVPRNCNQAAIYYKRAADRAIKYARSGPPGGLSLSRDAFRLADEEGGVYGEGASFSSSGGNSNRQNPNSDQNAAFDDVMEYLDLMSRSKDPKATYNLGRLHYDGSRTMKRNFKLARQYFLIVARNHWSQEDRAATSTSSGNARIASKAAAYLGRLYLRGEGVEQDFESALKWFKMGLANGDAFCHYELGLMYLLGLGVRRDIITASDYFKEAARQDWPSAHAYLGKIFLDQGDVETAVNCFENGARHGDIEAIYHLAEISNNGVGRERSCGIATAYYKIVAEKVEVLHSPFAEANAAYHDGQRDTALVDYIIAAEQGYEQAQSNAAYILDEQKSMISLRRVLPWRSASQMSIRDPSLGLAYWTRSAKQSNVDSIVKMGDSYFFGNGVIADLGKAASCYQSAAEVHQSAQAAWNLGWMHENGIGVEQDFHLASRFYIQAQDTNLESYLPVKLSLTRLHLRDWWNTMTRGPVNSIQPEPESSLQMSWGKWLTKLLEDEHPYYLQSEAEDGLDAHYPSSPSGLENAGGIDDKGFFDSLVIVSLAALLAFLVYFRQARLHNERRPAGVHDQGTSSEAERAPGDAAEDRPAPAPLPQQGNGFFPPQDHPNFSAWRAGGAGH